MLAQLLMRLAFWSSACERFQHLHNKNAVVMTLPQLNENRCLRHWQDEKSKIFRSSSDCWVMMTVQRAYRRTVDPLSVVSRG